MNRATRYAGAVLALVSLGSGTAWAFTTPQLAVDGCYDPLTGKLRILKDGETCKSQETLVAVVNGHFSTPHAEGFGNNDWGGRAFQFAGRTHVARYLAPSTYGLAVTNLADVADVVYARLDLDADGVDDLVWVDAKAKSLSVFYDFDDAKATSLADATIALDGTITLDAYDDGDDVLLVCNETECTELAGVRRGDEPETLP